MFLRFHRNVRLDVLIKLFLLKKMYMVSKVLNVSALYDCTPLDPCARFILRLADDEGEFGGCHSRDLSHLPLACP